MDAIHRVFNTRVEIKVSGGGAQETATALKVILSLTASSLAPAILISLTASAPIVIVLAASADRGDRKVQACGGVEQRCRAGKLHGSEMRRREAWRR